LEAIRNRRFRWGRPHGCFTGEQAANSGVHLFADFIFFELDDLSWQIL
jgi:hypothetical protein